MTEVIRKRMVMVNERGVRIGEGHPKAVLTDDEVAQLLADRGPEDLPAMTYLQLAKRYGISKTTVYSIVTGRTRGTAGTVVTREHKAEPYQAMAVSEIRLTLADRALLARLGGSKWVRKVLASVRNKNRRPYL